jgi:hypothetical protein
MLWRDCREMVKLHPLMPGKDDTDQLNRVRVAPCTQHLQAVLQGITCAFAFTRSRDSAHGDSPVSARLQP